MSRCTEKDWIEAENPLDSGVLLPAHVVRDLKQPLVMADRKHGMTLRDIASKHGISRQTALDWTRGIAKSKGPTND